MSGCPTCINPTPETTWQTPYICASWAHFDPGSPVRKRGRYSPWGPWIKPQPPSVGGIVHQEAGENHTGHKRCSFFPAKERKGPGRARRGCAPDNGRTKKTTTQQVVSLGPAPNPSSTLEPTATTSKHKMAASGARPWPGPPPKPNLIGRSFPCMSTRAVDALVAKPATSQNQNFVPHQLHKVNPPC